MQRASRKGRGAREEIERDLGFELWGELAAMTHDAAPWDLELTSPLSLALLARLALGGASLMAFDRSFCPPLRPAA